MKKEPTVSPANLTPRKVVQTYNPTEWEEFIEEWADGFAPPYAQVVRLGGPGDAGRDVVGYVNDPADRDGPWDSYQCKHYDHPLRPTEVYLELGKLIVHSQRGTFTVPRRYRFVAPREVGPKLHDFLRRPDLLRAELIKNWDDYCRKEIIEGEDIPLTGELRAYLDAFDFSIVWFLTQNEILAQHERTRYWSRRFKIEPPTRPPKKQPPDELQPEEIPYTSRLLEAYSDRLKRPIDSPDDLASEPNLLAHFRRSRGYFFSAEALKRFSRDYFPGGFDAISDHVYDGVADVADQTHADGYDCVLEVTKTAGLLELPASDLEPHVGPADKKGICHHLANDGKLCWCK